MGLVFLGGVWALEKWSSNVVHVLLETSLSFHFLLSLAKMSALAMLMSSIPMSWDCVVGAYYASAMLA